MGKAVKLSCFNNSVKLRSRVIHTKRVVRLCVSFVCRYASLYFCCAIEEQDNELITLEVIHRFVELLDKYFGSVSLSLSQSGVGTAGADGRYAVLRTITRQCEFIKCCLVM